ncbi:hypothetical protein BDA96_09G276200 [Sorghum bicolor]|uniref:Uncharacterized protein n=2 Tax=Sorghum bicolor TaxID=4558 RepID=A0A921QD41_SORBI|nr:hypothetical protein BDA96_09G276200 [Sorghum bicolor]KXG22738.1 hypothetical protein SORBI_3009G260800 [Sorghum bicolor]
MGVEGTVGSTIGEGRCRPDLLAAMASRLYRPGACKRGGEEESARVGGEEDLGGTLSRRLKMTEKGTGEESNCRRGVPSRGCLRAGG